MPFPRSLAVVLTIALPPCVRAVPEPQPSASSAPRSWQSVLVTATVEERPIERSVRLPARTALAVPRGAIVVLGVETVVYVRKDQGSEGPSKFEKRAVDVGDDWMSDGYVEVRFGLAKGETIVVDGSILLSNVP